MVSLVVVSAPSSLDCVTVSVTVSLPAVNVIAAVRSEPVPLAAYVIDTAPGVPSPVPVFGVTPVIQSESSAAVQLSPDFTVSVIVLLVPAPVVTVNSFALNVTLRCRLMSSAVLPSLLKSIFSTGYWLLLPKSHGSSVPVVRVLSLSLLSMSRFHFAYMPV